MREPDEFQAGIARTDELSRQTTLQERLGGEEVDEGIEVTAQTKSETQDKPSQSSDENAEAIEPGKFKLAMDTFFTIDPMIGMKGISPYNLEGVD